MSEGLRARTAALTNSPPSASHTPTRPSITPVRTALLQRACACGQLPGGKCDDCDKKSKGKVLQRAANGCAQPSSIPPVVNQALTSPGRPLDTSTRTFMESRFGHDFSQVRVHDDALANESAHAVNAKAYTVGQDIVFANGRYTPDQSSGRDLLAHELAHTIQQAGIQHSHDNVVFNPDHNYQHLEVEADRAAHAALNGSAINLSPAAGPTLSRVKDDDAGSEGKVVSTKGKKPGTKTSTKGAHKITPVEGFVSEKGSVEEFEVDPFYLPGAKGPAAKSEYTGIAGNKLETVLQLTSKGKTKTALWQKREVTEELRDRWLDKVGWTSESAADLWKRCGGAAEFPKTKAGTCQMDHVVELQLGGDNTSQNIQPLEQGPNQSSGGAIKQELESLATAIAKDPTMASPGLDEIKLRFTRVQPDNQTVEKLPTTCPPPGKASCLAIEKCATELKVEKSATGEVKVASVDYPISVGGGSPRSLKVPVTFAKAKTETVKIEGSPENNPASTLISGLLLTELRHGARKKKAIDLIAAKVDDRAETRLPVSLDRKAPPITLDVGEDGLLTLSPEFKKRTDIAFTYKYLSAGHITSLDIADDGSINWKGYIQPSVSFLGRLDVEYRAGELKVTKGLDPSQLKKPFPGVRISEATVGLILAPEFKPFGRLVLLFGPEAEPLATAEMNASTDGTGVVLDGTLRVRIPGVDKAEASVTYKGGGDYGAGSWTGQIVIESSKINLPYVQSGSLLVQLAKGRGVTVDGKLNLNLPGDNTATVGLRLEDRAWIFYGGGRFKVPKVGPVTVAVIYNTANKKLSATAKDVQFEIFGVTAYLKTLTAEIQPGHSPVFSGEGGADIKKGKVAGHVEIKLLPTGKFTGKGSVSYQFNENLTATAGVELDEQERLKFSGELLLTYFKLFNAFGDSKELFSFDISIPIPGASIGGVGLEGRVGGGITIEYSIGPGSLAPMKFSAGFYPLEDNPDLSLAVSGSINVPASASLTANVHADIVLDAFIAEVGGGVKLTGVIALKGGFFAPFSATYAKGKIDAQLTPEIKFALMLGLALSIRAWAKAGIGWLSVKTEKEWVLAKRSIDTGLGFSMKAPISYSSEGGVKFPSIDDIEFKKPEITTEKLKSILEQLVSGASTSEKED